VENFPSRKHGRRRLQFRIQHVSDFGIFLYITTLALVISQIFVNILDVDFDPTKPMHQASGLALGQLILLLGVGVVVVISALILTMKKISLIQGIKFVVITAIALISGVMTGSALVALDGTPFYFGVYGGDLTVHMQHVDTAIKYGWDQSGYPPLWSAMIARICVILNLDPFVYFKFISIYFIGIWAALNVVILRFAFPSVLAELLALYFTFSFGIDGWKSAGEIWTQILLLILVKRIYNLQISGRERNLSEKIATSSLGLLFGLSVTLYFGSFWWISPSLAISLGLVNFAKKNRFRIQLRLIDFSFGALFALLPILLLSSSGSLLTREPSDVVTAVKYILPGWGFILLIYLVWLFIKLPNQLQTFIGSTFSIVTPIVIFIAISQFKIEDTFTNGGYMFGNMTPEFGLTSTLGLIVISAVAILGAMFLAKTTSDQFPQIGFLFLNLISALMMMFYYAFDMYKTGNVELYPRAGYTIMTSWFLILANLFYLIATQLLHLFKSRLKQLESHEAKYISIAQLVLFSVIVAMYSSQHLSNIQWEMFPREGNLSWYAWTSRLTYLG
jgi:hypothetical protein